MLFADGCDSFCFGGFLALCFFVWIIGSAVQTTVDVAKKVIESDEAKEVGKGVVASWIDSWFK